MKEIFIKICRDLPQGLRASSHHLGGVSVYKATTEVLAIREQTKWDQKKGTYKRTGKYLVSNGFNIKKDLSFSQAAELTNQLLRTK
jgi:hypothetical protein